MLTSFSALTADNNDNASWTSTTTEEEENDKDVEEKYPALKSASKNLSGILGEFVTLNSKDNDSKKANNNEDDEYDEYRTVTVSELFQAKKDLKQEILGQAKKELKQELLDVKKIIVSQVDTERTALAKARTQLQSMRETFESKLKDLKEEKLYLRREQKLLADIKLEKSKLAREKKGVSRRQKRCTIEIPSRKVRNRASDKGFTRRI